MTQSTIAPGAAATASRFLKLSCDTVGEIFGKQSIEFGNEMHKLASVYYHRLVGAVLK